jgi:hypothetical protein
MRPGVVKCLSGARAKPATARKAGKLLTLTLGDPGVTIKASAGNE